MARNWYYVEDGERRGPIEEAILKTMIESGQLGSEDFLWTKGLENWKRLAELPEISGGEQSQLSPIPAPEMILTEPKLEDVSAQAAVFDWRVIGHEESIFFIMTGRDRNSVGTQYGPYSLSMLVKLFSEKRINARTYIWTKGLENWILLADIPIYSELFHEGPPQVTELDRRASIRRPFVAKMFFHNNSELYEGVCRDISVGGMQVLVPNFPGKPGEKISVNVHPDNSDYHFVASGKIVRFLNGNMGFSFRFVELNPDARTAIEHYVQNEETGA